MRQVAPPRRADDLPDIQAQADTRGVVINEAGIEGYRIPAFVTDTDGSQQSTVVRAAASVEVPETWRGAHMSRLVELFEHLHGRIRIDDLPEVYREMCRRSGVHNGHLRLEFPWFVSKTAPVSGTRSTLDVAVGYGYRTSSNGAVATTQRLEIPVTTLCPCSKAISRYGAHNQRSIVNVTFDVGTPLPINSVVRLVESCASSELFGVLKREDEKFVTENAYENAKFVEDVARDVFLALRFHEDAQHARVSVKSQESIHNHEAYAVIDDRRPRNGATQSSDACA